MATRPVFVPEPSARLLVREVPVEFTWHAGFAITQKQKSVRDLHESAGKRGLRRLLEISTKSEEKLGTRLSAFSLKVKIPLFGEMPLESAFQGSKVFERGGPYTDLYDVPPRDAKRDPRIRDSGKIIGFAYGEDRWPIEPRTAFYDWLYVNAIYPHREFLERLRAYDGFTDIEFNPARSLNCQARSCALFVALMVGGRLDDAVKSKAAFIDIVRNGIAPAGGAGGQQQPLL